ncbi:hypothetical protein [Mycolicibacterium mengxianglii]|uniref:hypothetical protein n=1 Tax=Mycolicibacterium mengxianglii TaxID=2736649 RepID=UPI0018D01569|nr:hypothetical protein [Mycolicibacterium mengxianglii]
MAAAAATSAAAVAAATSAAVAAAATSAAVAAAVPRNAGVAAEAAAGIAEPRVVPTHSTEPVARRHCLQAQPRRPAARR